MAKIAIKVDNVSKTFRLPHDKQSSIKGALINVISGGRRTFEKQQVLRDISFDINEGEFFGIVGRNGSGKSTLLKMLAGIYSPTSGAITINGKLTPFIELGVGFSPELTGRENIFLNGALLGFNRNEMNSMYQGIVKFAELEDFMDQKLKNYSSGMQVRLAFSIAVRAKTAILLIDEVLAVGDASFQQKCFEYFYQLKREKRTIVFVSHDMDSVQKFCDRAAVIHKGDLRFIGNPTEAAVIYKELNFPTPVQSEESIASGEEAYTKPDIKFTDKHGTTKQLFVEGETMVVNIVWKRNKKAQFLGVAIHRDDGIYVYGTNNIEATRQIQEDQTSAKYIVDLNLGSGKYYVEVAIFGKDESEKVFYVAQGPSFIVHNQGIWQGITELKHQWS